MRDVPKKPWVAAHRLPALAPAGGGGLATSMAGLLEGGHLAGWIGFHGEARADRQLVKLTLTENQLAGYRDAWCHRILWPLCHGWFDPSGENSLDDGARQGFAAYREANSRIAHTLAALLPESRAWVQIHDYQLLLVPGMLRQLRPDCGILFYLHVPVPEAGAWRWLPPDIRTALGLGLGAADLVGVQTSGDKAKLDELLGGGNVWGTRRRGRVETHPVPIDPEHLLRTARELRSRADRANLWPEHGRRILLVGRGDPSKNLPRSIEAIDRLLARNPDLCSGLSILCLAPESRQESAAYRKCQAEIRARMAALSHRWAQAGLKANLLEEDDRDRALMALEGYDILLVAPLADGMNLVAKEGALLNRNAGVIVASTHMGAWQALQPDCLEVHPLDTDGMSRALERALCMSPTERNLRSERMRCRMLREAPVTWLASQLSSAERPWSGTRHVA